ncbi:histone-lysine N-methyltransferase, H3 lysine-79 specific-like isoform X2 [Sitophilus oryzae]|uniref:Histone-lysine N-methyltransferase, H3 lysine-79 specific-like isoform X2 n=1 Tax=Sitophilus oryzae TaxID=7048 RepID=A0A6J2YFR7_SITOR|nr:histone-lysine N-methyltransferase, H3 lysine-79 specific-like isoform X2 [Sitophilus oryzae]
MNQNRPFYSTNTNCYDESFKSSAPTMLNGQNVIVSQEQQRRICDILNTSINGRPFQYSTAPQHQFIQANKQFFPGGVHFSFGQPHFQQDNSCKCGTNSNTMQLPVNTYFPTAMEPQRNVDHASFPNFFQPLPPYTLKLHYDTSTSSDDLPNYSIPTPISKCRADLNNICSSLEHQNPVEVNLPNCSKLAADPTAFFPLPPVEFSSNGRKLTLTKKTAEQPAGHVVDVLDCSNKKKVSFSDLPPMKEEKCDKTFQFTTECICESKKCPDKNKKKSDCESDEEEKSKKNKEKKKKSKKKKEKNEESTDSDTSESEPKKRSWFGRRKNKSKNSKEDLNSSASENTESDTDKENMKKSRKTKKREKDDEASSGSETSESKKNGWFKRRSKSNSSGSENTDSNNDKMES